MISKLEIAIAKKKNRFYLTMNNSNNQKNGLIILKVIKFHQHLSIIIFNPIPQKNSYIFLSFELSNITI